MILTGNFAVRINNTVLLKPTTIYTYNIILYSDGIPKVFAITEPSCPSMEAGTITRLEDLTRNSEYPGKDSNYEVDKDLRSQ